MNNTDLAKYERVFCFGCSFTNYFWPTWADILKSDVSEDIEIYNYGYPGLSNIGILRKVNEADILHEFTNNDAIFIMWTAWNRECRYINKGWHQYGNLSSSAKFLRFYSEGHEIAQNSNAILSIRKILGNKLKKEVQGFDIDWEDYAKDNYKMTNFFKEKIPNNLSLMKLPSYETYDAKWDSGHPSVKTQLDGLEILFDYHVTRKTKTKFLEIDNKLKTFLRKTPAGIVKRELAKKFGVPDFKEFY